MTRDGRCASNCDVVRVACQGPGYLYILRCRDGLLYTGRTNDLIRRLARHRAGKVRSTKSRLPVQLIYFEEFETPIRPGKGSENSRTAGRAGKRSAS
ncbi:MAG: GIY-YIG nuclease family protein [Phycisphaerales bacterium]|nr:GIY-YIG nuclease family protein [Phycisphaerales bacterium]